MTENKPEQKNKKEESKVEYLTLKETAFLAATPYAKVKRDIESGFLQAYHIGRKYFIKKEAAQDYAEKKSALLAVKGFTIREVMEIIPLSYAFIMGLIRNNKLEAIKVGRQYIIPHKSFYRYLEENKAKAQEEQKTL